MEYKLKSSNIPNNYGQGVPIFDYCDLPKYGVKWPLDQEPSFYIRCPNKLFVDHLYVTRQIARWPNSKSLSPTGLASTKYTMPRVKCDVLVARLNWLTMEHGSDGRRQVIGVIGVED